MHKAIGASPGIAFGKAYIYFLERGRRNHYTITYDEIPKEKARLQEALKKSEKQLRYVKEQLKSKGLADHVHIFDAHLLILYDQHLWKELYLLIEKEMINLEWALYHIREKYTNIFSQIEDEVFREKQSDIHDVIDRIIDNLCGKDYCLPDEIPPNSILFAHDLPPSVTMCLNIDNMVGFVTEVGGRTSHVAILARALEIPAIVGLENIFKYVQDQDDVIIDGSRGEVIIDPTEAITTAYKTQQQQAHIIAVELQQEKDLDAVTLDGYRVEIAANIEFLREIPSIKTYGAEGIGLYRTEFLYMSTPALPTEEEHYQVYSNLAKQMYPRQAVIRTLDAGGDKFISDLNVDSMKDFMGLRAIRLFLKRPDLFKTQLRAIVRANFQNNLKVMFPMISSLNELQQAKEIYHDVCYELEQEGEKVQKLELGIMIEVPSAAITADILASEVDFFSIGTNDLIQYSLAINRVNKEVAYLYEPLHPAILRTIDYIVNAAHQKGVWVSICGEMAGEPLYTPILVGMGIDELSMNGRSIPKVKKMLRNINFSNAKQLKSEVLKAKEPKTIRKILTEFIKENTEVAELINQ